MGGLGALSSRVALAVAILAVSWGSILARLCVSGPLAIAFYRLLLTVLIILPFVLATRRGGPPVRRLSVLLLMLGSGALLAIHFASWIASLSFTSVGSSVLLVSTAPVFAVVLSRFFLGERADLGSVLGVGLTLLGTCAIAWGDLGSGEGHWFGDLLALAGAVSGAGYFLIGRGTRTRVPFGSYLLWVYGSGAAILALMAALSGRLLEAVPEDDWLWLLLMAAGPGVTGHGLLNWSVRRVRAYVVNAALLGEPILATIYAWVLFDERPGGHLLAGGLLIVAGLAWVFRQEGRRARTAAVTDL